MLNTFTILLDRVDKLTEEQRQALRESIKLWYMKPVDEYTSHWRITLHPILNIENGNALNYLHECYKHLAEQYPTVPVQVILSQEPANAKQCEAVWTQLLEEWKTVCLQLDERIKAKTETTEAYWEALGTRSAYERAKSELGRMTEFPLDPLPNLIKLRNILYTEYAQAAHVYHLHNHQESGEETGDSTDFHQSRGRYHAYNSILNELTRSFRLPSMGVSPREVPH